MKANAVVAVEPWRVEFKEIDVPDPGLDDVVIRVTHSWISNGTEGSFVRGERIAGDTLWVDGDPVPFPHVPGYQKVGVVEWLGEAVTGLSIGQTVFATVSKVTGMFYGSGGHVSPAVTHQSQVWALPDGLDPVAASGLTLAQVGYNVGTCAPTKPDDKVVVLGDGLVGHWSAQTLQMLGCTVCLVGRHPDRLSKFDPGADGCVLNARDGGIEEAIRRWAPEGIALVADTVGSIESIEALYPAMRHAGRIVSAGFYGRDGLINIQKMRAKELSLHAPAGWSKARMDATLAALGRGDLQTLPLITHRIKAAEAGAAFEMILHKMEPHLGVVLDW